jgi:multidrug efflux pump subunit AcrA (membrane-fusion protein)
MAAAGFKGTVSLTVDESGARLTDAVTGHVVEMTELEGRVLELYRGQTAEVLASEAQAKGIGLWPDQVRVVLERIEAHGFLAKALKPEANPAARLGPGDVVPRFRSDLSLSKAPGSRSAIHVVDPVTQQAFSLFDFEASIARMLNGSRTVTEVIDLAGKIGIPVSAESLERFIRQLRSFGFLDNNVSAAAPSSWDPRDAWSPDVRELYQAALRLMRSGNPQQALNYIDAILQTNPDLPEALDLRTRAEAAAAGTIDLTLPFNELHAGPPPTGEPAAPPPPPDETTAEHLAVAPPPKVAKVQGLGLLPAPQLSPPRGPAARSTMIFGSRAPPVIAPMAGVPAPPPVAPAAPPGQVSVSLSSDALPAAPRERSTLVFGKNPLGEKSNPQFASDPAALGIRPRESASGPRQFNSVLFGASSGQHNIAESPPPTEPSQSIFVAGPAASGEPARSRRLQPPSASPPPRGAEALFDPLGSSNPDVPVVLDAEMAPTPPPEPPESTIEVDAMAFVPQGNSVEVDPSLSEPSNFVANDFDAPPAPDRIATPPEVRAADAPEAIAQTPLDAAFAANPSGERMSQEMMVLAGVPPEDAPRKKRRGVVLVAVLVTLIAGAMAVPVPRQIEAACVVAPVVLAEPTAQVEGKVGEIVVKSGDVVAAGTVLVKLNVAEPPEAKALAEKQAELEARVDKIRAAAKTSPKAKKANAALAKAEKELARAKSAWARQEPKKPSADRTKAKKAFEAKQKARDKAQAAADVETGAKRIAAVEGEVAAIVAQRAKLTQEAAGTTIVAPAAGRFEAPAKHALGMGLEKDERYGRIVDPGLWKVSAKELPVSTEPGTAKLKLENGRLVDLTSTTLSGEGATRVLEGNALLTDDATSAGKTVLQVRAGKRPLAVVVLQKLRSL